MFEHALVYNPAFGTEENIDPQLVYAWRSDGPLETAEGVRLIGVVQGIVELANSFGEEPAKFFKTGVGALAKLTVVVPLTAPDAENWRLRYWFAGQLPLPRRSWIAPEMIYCVVEEVFKQHRLSHGEVAGRHAYWLLFVSRLNEVLASRETVAMLSVVPQALRVAAGTLDPSTAQAIDKLRGEAGALDVLVTTTDGASVYAGCHLNRATRNAVQKWLHFNAQNSIVVEPKTKHADAAPEPPSEQEQQNVSEEMGASQEPSAKVWWPALPALPLPSMPALPSVSLLSISSLPSMPAMPSMPSLPSMPSVSLPSLPSMSWSAPVEPRNGLQAHNAELFDLESGKKIFVSVWKQTLYNYIAIFEAPKEHLTNVFELLSIHLEGFSFAFAPPTRFYYLIYDPRTEKMVSTFPLSTDAIGSLVAFESSKEQRIVRLGTMWLYFTALENGIQAVLGKKNVENEPTTLLGEFQADIHQWLEDYVARGVLE